jgi:hypothetical protein
VPREIIDYLLRLTTLAVSFVGFSAMVVALRRARGAELDELHMHFVRMFIEGGLAVAVLGLQPVLLSFTGLGEDMIWRVSSASAALLFTAYLITLSRRRRELGDALPKITVSVVVNFIVSIAAIVTLWINAANWWFERDGAAYVIAVTWFLILGGWVFMQNLDRFLRNSSSS